MNTNEASKITAIKDQALGTIKETFGTMTGNAKMELVGKAQKVHGKNEYEYAQAQLKGESEPEKFKQAYHDSAESICAEEPRDRAEGTVEGDSASSFTGMKDRTIGAVKETIGSMTGSQNMELLGKAQKVHGRNESEFAKAESKGLSEPQHFVQGTKISEHAEGCVEGEKTSSISAFKDQTVGALKETIGSATGNQTMELLGKAQNVHGRNEAEFAKAQQQGLREPEHFAQGTKTCDHAEGTVEGDSASSLSAIKDRAIGTVKETVGRITGQKEMELLGKAQNVHGRNEAEFAKAEKCGLREPEHFVQGTKTCQHAEGTVEGEKASMLSAMKDVTAGTIKESFGSAAGDQKLELLGKAQKVHGRNEAEFAKAERKGLIEPEHFVEGTKTSQHAEGSVEGDSTSTLSAAKDQAVGTLKEAFGTATGNQNLELLGKAQSVHGRNEAEFAKAERKGEAEPEHFGKKITEHANGTVEGEDFSRLTALKDQVVGAVKEKVGSATKDHEMELIGKAQNVHGRNATEFSSEQLQVPNA